MKSPLLALILLVPWSTWAGEIFNDTFADGNCSEQSLPASLHWYDAGDQGELKASAGEMILSTASRSQTGMTLAYFTESTSPLKLAPGQSAVLTYTFSLKGLNDPGGFFRVALLNSRGKRIAADGEGLSNDIFSDYQGYVLISNLQSGANGKLAPNRRDKSNPALLVTNAAFTALAPGGKPYRLADATTYTGVFTIFFDGAAVTFTNEINGDGLSKLIYSATDNAPQLEFDTVAFAFQKSTGDQVTFHSVTLAVESGNKSN